MAGGFLKVVSEEELQAHEQEEILQEEEREQEFSEQFADSVAHFVRTQYDQFRRHRTRQHLTSRMLEAQRAYNGQYSPEKQAEIKNFGGSDVYARLTAIKCRGATAMLRDVYLSGSKPWEVTPTPVPDVPSEIKDSVDSLVEAEVKYLIDNGQEPPPDIVSERRKQLMKAAREAAQREARKRARDASDEIEDKLIEGGFYDALAEFLIDLPIFPFAVLKGPVMKMARKIEWEEGKPVAVEEPIMTWKRVSCFDFYWTPSATCIEEADCIERQRLRRSELQALIGVPGYDDEAIKAALEDYTNGYFDHLDDSDAERASNEDRENPMWNQSHDIYCLEFQGDIPGEKLATWNDGKFLSQIDGFDPAFDYNVICFVVGRHTIKVQVQPHPAIRHNYFGTSFEKVSGALVGRALPEILSDSQHVANAAFRALVNNMGIASGPQVVLNEDRLSPTTTDSLYPWKRWRFTSDPLGTNEKPIDFFQPQSNANELYGVFDRMMMLGDEVSGIPRYLTGNQNVSGAASTASGLNQLMNNASKVLQQVAGQIDQEVLQPLLEYLYYMVILTDDTELSWGDSTIKASGVTMAMAKEADRQRQLEFLQLTANPLDQGLVGVKGRAVILRGLADSLGLDGERIIPSEEELQALEEQRRQQEALAAQAQGAQAPAPGPSDNRPNRGLDNAQRTRTPQAISNQASP